MNKNRVGIGLVALFSLNTAVGMHRYTPPQTEGTPRSSPVKWLGDTSSPRSPHLRNGALGEALSLQRARSGSWGQGVRWESMGDRFALAPKGLAEALAEAGMWSAKPGHLLVRDHQKDVPAHLAIEGILIGKTKEALRLKRDGQLVELITLEENSWGGWKIFSSLEDFQAWVQRDSHPLLSLEQPPSVESIVQDWLLDVLPKGFPGQIKADEQGIYIELRDATPL